MKRTTKALILGTAAGIALTGCTAADVASQQLSTAADAFEIERRIVFVNGITNDYLLTIEGRCSIYKDVTDEQLEVTCKVADGDGASAYKKHFLGLSDNVTYVAEQLDAAEVSEYHYRVIFRPETIVPTFEVDIEDGQ